MATLDPVIFEKYAIAAGAAYSNQPVPLGMEFLAASPPSSTGFAATAFRDTATGQVIISVRVSNDLNDWTGSNLELLQQKMPQQYREAELFFNECRATALHRSMRSCQGALRHIVSRG